MNPDRIPDALDIATGDAPQRALAAIEPELRALDRSEVAPANLSAPRACATVLAALPAIRGLRAEIARRLPEHPVERIDRLERYALAALCAHLATEPRSGARIRALFAEGKALARELSMHARALALKGLIEASALDAFAKGRGHLATASALTAATMLLRSRWDAVRGKTALEPGDLDRAERIARELCEIAGRRGRVDPTVVDGLDVRARALTLLVRAYDDTRHAIAYVRRKEGDADVIAPSLFAKRRRRSHPGPAPDGEVAPVVAASGG